MVKCVVVVILPQAFLGCALFEVEPTEEHKSLCECCGNETRKLVGWVNEDGGAVAGYFIEWTVGMPFDSHPANFDIIYGRWGEGAESKDRCAISLLYFEQDGRPGVMAIDANDRPVGSSSLVGKAMNRDEIIGTDMAKQAFSVFDTVLLGDKRLAGCV